MTVPAGFVAQRLEPVGGGLLRAADLRDLLELADHQRRRHLRALHDTWGIAAGLRIAETSSGLVVSPGVAYDRCGRMLVLGTTLALAPVVGLPHERIVVLRGDRSAREPAATVVVADGRDLDVGLDVVLATLAPSDGQVVATSAGRRYVRTAAPVALAAGSVRHGTVVVDKKVNSPHAWAAWIAVDAGFRATPVYTAGVSAALRSPAPQDAVAPFGTATVELSHQSPVGFRITVRRAVPAAADLDATTLHTNPDDISWIAALAQPRADVRDPVPATGLCAGPTPETEHP
jgi:hypothetical protein